MIAPSSLVPSHVSGRSFSPKPARAFLESQSAMSCPSVPRHTEGKTMSDICEPTPRKSRGGRNSNKARLGTADLSDWLADALRNKPAKEIADDAGCGIRTAENAKQGRNALSAKHLANMQMNDPVFAAAWAEYVGLILPGDAEFVGAMTRAAHAYMRRHP